MSKEFYTFLYKALYALIYNPILTVASKNTRQAQPPLIPSINNINIKVAKLHSEARKKVSGDDFIDAIKEIDRLSKEQIDIEKKRILALRLLCLGVVKRMFK